MPPGRGLRPPAATGTIVFTRLGRIVGRARVGAYGRFSLRLAPGRYAVRLVASPLPGGLSPVTVTVPPTGVFSLRLTVKN